MHDYSSAHWYFITLPLSTDQLPKAILEIPFLLRVLHWFETSPGRFVLNGYIDFKFEQTYLSLLRASGDPYQWIPSAAGYHIRHNTGVDIAPWAREDFNLERFLKDPYPRNSVHEALFRYVSYLCLCEECLTAGVEDDPCHRRHKVAPHYVFPRMYYMTSK